jgi:hypothetical protein
MRCANGQIIEVIQNLDGRVHGLDPEDLDQFVSRFPIQRLAR